MEFFTASPFLRNVSLGGVAVILAAVWGGTAAEQVASSASAPKTLAASVAANGIDGTPTGSIVKPVPLNPCVMPAKP